MDNTYNTKSERALCTIKVDTPEGVNALEQCVVNWKQRADEDKSMEAQGWFQNLAFLLGNHFTRISFGTASAGTAGPDTSNWSIRPLSVTKDRYKAELMRNPDNQILQPHEEFVSLLSKSDPLPYVRPNSGSIEDRDSAKLAEIAYKVHWETVLDMPSKQNECSYYLSVFGNCAAESDYEELDVPVERPILKLEQKSPEEVDEIFGEAPLVVVKNGTEVSYKYGETVNIHSPFHYSVNPGADHTDESILWIMRHSLEDIDWVKEQYGEVPDDKKDDEYYFPDNVEDIAPGLRESDPLVLYDYLKSMIGSPERLYHAFNYSNSYKGAVHQDNRVVLTVTTCKPNKHFPKGRTIISAGGKLLYCGPSKSWSIDYPERWHSFAFDRYNKIPGKFWGEAMLSPLIPLQKQLNKMDGIKRIHHHFLALGQYVVPEGSIDPRDSMDAYPGKIWKVKPGMGVPQRLTNDNLPSGVDNDRAELVQSIRNKARINEILNTQSATSNIRSGSMIQLLQNEKVESRSHVIIEHQSFLQKIARNILIDISINLKEEDPELTRKISIAAREYSGIEINHFVGTDLRDNVHIRIDIMPSLLQSPEAEQQRVIDFIQALGGQNLSPDEKAQAWNILRFDEISNDQTLQTEAAQRMLGSIEAGDFSAVVVDPFNQDPSIFANIFSNATLKPNYKTLPMEVKQVIQSLGATFQQIYQERQQEYLQQQIRLQQLAGGKPPQ